jgi:hypothetical protein
MADDYIEEFHFQLIKCEGKVTNSSLGKIDDPCQVEATRDVWLRWGLACPECGKKKMAV